ncbi:hypothetical protein [Anatilimnocola aggregata]|nr:hypothetical protein [Anatilimnocola aggregata]
MDANAAKKLSGERQVHIRMFWCAIALLAGSSSQALALPPFSRAWRDRYLSGDVSDEYKVAAEMARCHVCHKIAAGKALNSYGKAAGKFLTKDEWVTVRDEPAKLRLYIDNGLKQAEAEKSPSGRTFGELIKDGIGPWD